MLYRSVEQQETNQSPAEHGEIHDPTTLVTTTKLADHKNEHEHTVTVTASPNPKPTESKPPSYWRPSFNIGEGLKHLGHEIEQGVGSVVEEIEDTLGGLFSDDRNL